VSSRLETDLRAETRTSGGDEKIGGEIVGRGFDVTLLDLVAAIGEVTADDTEVVATAVHMLRRAGVVAAVGRASEPALQELR